MKNDSILMERIKQTLDLHNVQYTYMLQDSSHIVAKCKLGKETYEITIRVNGHKVKLETDIPYEVSGKDLEYFSLGISQFNCKYTGYGVLLNSEPGTAVLQYTTSFEPPFVYLDDGMWIYISSMVMGAQEAGKYLKEIAKKPMPKSVEKQPTLKTSEEIEKETKELLRELEEMLGGDRQKAEKKAARSLEDFKAEFKRYERLYEAVVGEEIAYWISEAENRRDREFALKKLRYLIPLHVSPGGFCSEVTVEKIRQTMKETFYGMDKVIEEVTSFYRYALLSDEANMNLALCGGMGVGKTAVCEAIAKALGYRLCKISLNGMRAVEELKGFAASFKDAEPGCVVGGTYKAGNFKVLFEMDELDKANQDILHACLDLLDREFTDAFIGFPVKLPQVLFIATCNDWDAIPPVLRDRFTLVKVPGYMRSEKKLVMREYLIPKMEKKLSKRNVSISLSEEAEEFLLMHYCTSFGIRDVEKALQKLVACRLDNVSEGKKHIVHITVDGIIEVLGQPPIRRGNFPEGDAKPGIAKALAVTEKTHGHSFAIETILMPHEGGGESKLLVTGRLKESAMESVQKAYSYVKAHYGHLLEGKDMHIDFAEGGVQKDGPSAGLAVVMSMISCLKGAACVEDKPYDIAFSGEIDLSGGVYAVGCVPEKIHVAVDSGCKVVFVPKTNYEREKEKLTEMNCKVIPVSNVSEVLDMVFYKNTP